MKLPLTILKSALELQFKQYEDDADIISISALSAGDIA